MIFYRLRRKEPQSFSQRLSEYYIFSAILCEKLCASAVKYFVNLMSGNLGYYEIRSTASL